MKKILAVLFAVGLVAAAMTGCSNNEGNGHGGATGSGEASCAHPSIRAADAQSLTVSPGESVTLIAQDIVDHECVQPDSDATEPPRFTAALFEVRWTQTGVDVPVAEITSNGDPVEIAFAVPEDAVPGPAVVMVDDATLELEVIG